VQRAVSYRDAVELLGGDPPALAALDRVLAGALSLATGGVSDVVLDVFDAQPRIVLLGRDLLGKLRDRLRGTSRMDRTERLAAAHAVIVITAYFDALGKAGLPFRLKDLKLTEPGQIPRTGRSPAVYLHQMVRTAPPQPTPEVPAERFTEILYSWYLTVTANLLSLAGRVLVDPADAPAPDWDSDQVSLRFSDTGPAHALAVAAISRYHELYAQLAVDVPEFRFWAGQLEHQATRAEVRRALGGVEVLLAGLIARDARLGGSGTSPADALAREYRAALARPILSEGDTPSGVRMPSLEEGYLDPDFRVRVVDAGELPADEDWWAGAAVRRDLTEYLAGALTSLEAMARPLVVLGQPGAGKSVLTKVLAARLPEAGFLPVRVVLREVAAEADIQDQVESAIRAATGRRLEWPDVATAAPGATPVVLLDGFDELLQATGVSQSDYLERVARFQQREADQGRPAVMLVTTRTAVADRARYPLGTVALRLEPFRDDQVARWLDMWNTANADRLQARGLRPLTSEIVARYEALAGEPLLLLMLALYDADANALQGAAGDQSLDESRLYEDLLTSFARREVSRWGSNLPVGELAGRVEQEMQRLSLIAFSMVNRGRQWVAEAELDADLTALLGGRGAGAGVAGVAGFQLPLSPGGIAVGRFFFVQRNQAISADTRLATFEFLHATFGEYLIARLTVQLAAGLAAQRPALAVGYARLDDDLLYALLSFGPLSARQMMRFVAGCCDRMVAAADRSRLTDVLISVLADAQGRTTHKHDTYAPVPLATAVRHGTYSANLVLLILSLSPSVTASRLFRGARDPAGRWRGMVLLWRSSLREQDWTDLALVLRLRRFWDGSERDVQISLCDGERQQPEPVDLYWHYWFPPSLGDRGPGVTWHRSYADEVDHKTDLSAGTNESVLRHALEPVFALLGDAVMSFHGNYEGLPTSAAHDLISLCLLRTADCPDDELLAAYQRAVRLFGRLDSGNPEQRRRITMLMLRMLEADFPRLPAERVEAYLIEANVSWDPRDTGFASALADVAVPAMLAFGRDLPENDGDLAQTAAQALHAIDPSLTGQPAGGLVTAAARHARINPADFAATYPDLVTRMAKYISIMRELTRIQDPPAGPGPAST
jgi:hypothetical protein